MWLGHAVILNRLFTLPLSPFFFARSLQLAVPMVGPNDGMAVTGRKQTLGPNYSATYMTCNS